ncbi:hypothetical protein SteCoe_18511 [Stentor coeruleus]|uniref:Uncharacterized protein n=1 Tax=Stentor coeruleus TaxID=5963 RepID=A0A1R2BWA4_9CILI|nr:hypothetical protein SteCoe_18511 [Stentor coeruleus]
MEDVEAYKSQNECLKSSVREIQDSLVKAEREIVKYKKYIESLESQNNTLETSNKNLRTELEKIKNTDLYQGVKLKHIKPSVPEIFMNPKLVGDVDNSYNISLSDSEPEKSTPILEEEKQEPKVFKVSNSLA